MEPLGAVLLSAACLAYNNVLNAWPRFQGALFVPLNLIFAAIVTTIAVLLMDLSRDGVGLHGDAGDVLIGLLTAAAVTGPIFAVAFSRHARRVADRRVAGLSGSDLAYQVFVRVPLGTAVTEEVLFRGVVFAAWRATGLTTTAAALMAAAVFGLWHVSPTINLVRANAPDATRRSVGLAVLGAVAFTTAAGAALTWLRLETEGLAAPIALHAGTNSLGTIAAVIAGRRSAREGPSPTPDGGSRLR